MCVELVRPFYEVESQGLLRHQYDVSADGKRFLLTTVGEGAANAPITVISNWRGFRTP